MKWQKTGGGSDGTQVVVHGGPESFDESAYLMRPIDHSSKNKFHRKTETRLLRWQTHGRTDGLFRGV